MGRSTTRVLAAYVYASKALLGATNQAVAERRMDWKAYQSWSRELLRSRDRVARPRRRRQNLHRSADGNPELLAV